LQHEGLWEQQMQNLSFHEKLNLHCAPRIPGYVPG